AWCQLLIAVFSRQWLIAPGAHRGCGRAATPPALVEASDRGVPPSSEHQGARDHEQCGNDEGSAADGRTRRGEILEVIATVFGAVGRSEEHTSELQSRFD